MAMALEYEQDHDIYKLLSKIPERTAWVRKNLPFMKRCKDSKALAVLGMCYKMDDCSDLDHLQELTPLTIQILMALEHILRGKGWKIYLNNFSKECRASFDELKPKKHATPEEAKARSGCVRYQHCAHPGEAEMVVNSAATIVELLVAQREYHVDIQGVWGISASFNTKIDDGIFGTSLEVVPANTPRVHNDFHIGQLSSFNVNPQLMMITRRSRLQAMCKSLAVLVDIEEASLYRQFRDWFTQNTTFIIPDLEFTLREPMPNTSVGNAIRDALFLARIPKQLSQKLLHHDWIIS